MPESASPRNSVHVEAILGLGENASTASQPVSFQDHTRSPPRFEGARHSVSVPGTSRTSLRFEGARCFYFTRFDRNGHFCPFLSNLVKYKHRAPSNLRDVLEVPGTLTECLAPSNLEDRPGVTFKAYRLAGWLAVLVFSPSPRMAATWPDLVLLG